MPPKKSVTQEKPIKQVQKVVVKEVSENEDSGDEIEMSDDESDDDEEDDENESDDDVEDKKEVKEPKEKVKKQTHEEILVEIDNLNKENTQLDTDISELDKQITTKDKLRIANRKKVNKLYSLLSKAYIDGCNKARKEKTRRTNSARSGILREKPVPAVLIKFLKLPENDVKSQSKLFHLLNEEFKKRNLKQGQKTVLDKETAEIFGEKAGYTIEFKDHQGFLSRILNSDKKNSNEVSL
jgi:hypothetical protein